MKIYALLTLHVTAWGTRQGVDNQNDTPDSPDISEKIVDEESLHQSHVQAPVLTPAPECMEFSESSGDINRLSPINLMD
ncbi:hypothetical protein K7432_012646 [Basidiobolus ranarum]|uniref:Uncharacterized protein n=1 Tax=Basidiobolus ranarum TaxID=34480 RepID=A0ABR2VS51_9FUNG